MCQIEFASDDQFPEHEISFDENWDWDPEYADIHDMTTAHFGSKFLEKETEAGVAYVHFVYVELSREQRAELSREQREQVCSNLACQNYCTIVPAEPSEKMSTVLERFCFHHLKDRKVLFLHSGKEIRGSESVHNMITGSENNLVVNVAEV